MDFLSQARASLNATIARAKSGRPQPKALLNYWDFTKIRHITPTVALMIAAEYDRAHSLIHTRFPAIDIPRWSRPVAEVMSEVGFFDLLEISKKNTRYLSNSPPNNDGLRVIKMRSNSLAQSELAGELITELEGLSKDLTQESEVDFDRLYGALFEGITNTKHHAYPSDFDFEHSEQWWATGFVDKRTRTIGVIVYDQGVTIPASLPSSWMVGHLANLFGASWAAQDGASIAAAMQVSQSSTRLPHRGLGLAEMEAFMQTCKAGRLRILSRNGEYVAEVGQNPRHATHKDAVLGTLVQWEVVV